MCLSVLDFTGNALRCVEDIFVVLAQEVIHTVKFTVLTCIFIHVGIVGNLPFHGEEHTVALQLVGLIESLAANG